LRGLLLVSHPNNTKPRFPHLEKGSHAGTRTEARRAIDGYPPITILALRLNQQGAFEVAQEIMIAVCAKGSQLIPR